MFVVSIVCLSRVGYGTHFDYSVCLNVFYVIITYRIDNFIKAWLIYNFVDTSRNDVDLSVIYNNFYNKCPGTYWKINLSLYNDFLPKLPTLRPRMFRMFITYQIGAITNTRQKNTRKTNTKYNKYYKQQALYRVFW